MYHTTKPYDEQMTFYVKNADHFIDIMRQLHVKSTGMLVSFDVTSLFTQVPINEIVSIIGNKHQVEDHLINLIQDCLKNTYSTYNGERYRQIEGAPIRSPIIANMLMEDFEITALDTAKYKAKLWLRYVNDIFHICTHSENKL
ncbi:hypothetical protein Trydic_g19593 [Trypoxylus dichotomus]